MYAHLKMKMMYVPQSMRGSNVPPQAKPLFYIIKCLKLLKLQCATTPKTSHLRGKKNCYPANRGRNLSHEASSHSESPSSDISFRIQARIRRS